MSRRLRGYLRLLAFGLLSVLWAALWVVLGSWRRGRSARHFGAHWLHGCTPTVLRILGIHVEQIGQPDEEAQLIVSNHLSYVDVFTLASRRPVVFLSKWEVQEWPWGGTLARCAGTLYIKRLIRGDVPRALADVIATVDDGVTVVMFLEGTTTDGSSVLPFSSALLQPAVDRGWKIQTCRINYDVEERGSPEGIAWVGDTAFFEHVQGLVGLDHATATVAFGPTFQGSNRKALSKQLHESVSSLPKAPAAPDPAPRAANS